MEEGLTLEIINSMQISEIKSKIFEANFNNNKSKFIKKLAETISTEYSGKVPTKFSEVLKLPGVGNKIALLYMQILHG